MAERKRSQSFLDFLDDTPSKEDVAGLFKKLVEFVKEAKKKLEELFAKHEEEVSAKIQELEAKLTDTEGRVSQRQDEDKETMYSESRTLQRLLDQKEAEIRASIPDPTDLSPYDQKLADIEARIPNLPEELSAEGMRDKLEALPEGQKLIIEAIEGLREELDALKKTEAKMLSGGGGQLDVSHWPRHEEFTMDGVATTVTLLQAVGAGGNAIFGVRWQGQTLDMTTHYTVSGNKITLVGITPSSGDIISVTYVP